MRVLVLAILLCSLARGDLGQKGQSRVYVSEVVGNRLVTHRVRPTCPDWLAVSVRTRKWS
jgi:hypothetical protein